MKSKKTVASMIESTNKEIPGGKKKNKSVARTYACCSREINYQALPDNHHIS